MQVSLDARGRGEVHSVIFDPQYFMYHSLVGPLEGGGRGRGEGEGGRKEGRGEGGSVWRCNTCISSRLPG